MDQSDSIGFTPTRLAREAGISVPYASQLLSRTRTATVPLAVSIFRKTGVRVAPIENATEAEIEVLARYGGETPA